MDEEVSIIINSFRADTIYRIHVPILSITPYQATGAGYFFAYPDYYVERNNLNMYLLLLTIRGAGEITYRGQTFLLEPGNAVLINGLEYHKYLTQPSCAMWEFKWLRFSLKNMQELDELYSRFDLTVFPAKSPELQGLFDSFIATVDTRDEQDEIKLSAISGMIFSILYDEIRSSSTLIRSTNSLIAKSLQIIQKNYTQPLSVEDLAKSCYITSYSYIRLFKHMTGISPHQYLIRTRLNESCVLLENSSDNIAMIAEKTGFASQNNYAKQFRKQYGLSPTQYRKQFGFVRVMKVDHKQVFEHSLTS